MKDESNGKTKDAFKVYLKSQVEKEVNCQIDELEYNDKRIKKVLLLFNIQTILASQKAEMRFPFYKYKDDDWDIEHVRSQTDKQITAGTRKDWALDVLEYLTGVSGYSDEIIEDCSEKDLQIQAIEQMAIIEDKAETYKLCKRLCDVLNAPKVNDEIFNNLYTDILKQFKESEALQNINGIANLALLDSATNRSYKNAMFPIKRKTIIQNDKNGIFVPLCTKNLFLKYYSKKMDELMYWKEDDAKNYVEAIKNTLAEYLPNQTNGHE